MDGLEEKVANREAPGGNWDDITKNAKEYPNQYPNSDTHFKGANLHLSSDNRWFTRIPTCSNPDLDMFYYADSKGENKWEVFFPTLPDSKWQSRLSDYARKAGPHMENFATGIALGAVYGPLFGMALAEAGAVYQAGISMGRWVMPRLENAKEWFLNTKWAQDGTQQIISNAINGNDWRNLDVVDMYIKGKDLVL